MTLKKAYINLLIALILVILNIILYALDVSRLTIHWTTTIFWFSTVLSLSFIGASIYHFKQKIIIDKVEIDEEVEIEENIKNEHIYIKHRFVILDWLSFLGLSLMLILIMFMFFILPTNVEGSSMKSTLLDGERVLMYHFNYEPQRNDVVIVHITDRYLDTTGRQVNTSNQYDNQDQVYFVKRVVAVPNDVVTFEEIGSSETYHILINGVVYQNQYFQIYQVDDAGRLKMLSYLNQNNQLRENQYFAFGDNESFSYDSRNIGAIHKDDMIGKAIYKLLPLGGISHG
jgi:signal peptidase I